MKVIAINSSHNQLSVALNCDGEIASKEVQSQRSHNQFVLELVDSLLREKNVELEELGAVTFGEGPGSFTGLRIAAAVAQGLAFGLDIPAIGVSCMAAVAQSISDQRVVVAFNGKQGNMFWAAYERNDSGIVSAVIDDAHTAMGDISLPGKGWHGAGVGWDIHSEELLAMLGDSVTGWTPGKQPHAHEISIIGSALYEDGKSLDFTKLAVPNYVFPFSIAK